MCGGMGGEVEKRSKREGRKGSYVFPSLILLSSTPSLPSFRLSLFSFFYPLFFPPLLPLSIILPAQSSSPFLSPFIIYVPFHPFSSFLVFFSSFLFHLASPFPPARLASSLLFSRLPSSLFGVLKAGAPWLRPLCVYFSALYRRLGEVEGCPGGGRLEEGKGGGMGRRGGDGRRNG